MSPKISQFLGFAKHLDAIDPHQPYTAKLQNHSYSKAEIK